LLDSQAGKPSGMANVKVNKDQLMGYYSSVAGIMLKHLAGHPLILKPIGSEALVELADVAELVDNSEASEPGASTTPPPVISITHPNRESIHHVLCNKPDQLPYLAEQGTVSFYRCTSTVADIQSPRYLIFDLNPAADDFRPVRLAAFRLRRQLESLSLEPFVMTTGRNGLHVVTPIRPDHSYDAARSLASAIARLITERYPEELTTEQRTERRHGRTYINVLHNAFGQIAVAPYSVRDLPAGPVATPITWQELEESIYSSRQFNIGNVAHLLNQRPDPWLEIEADAANLDEVERLLRAQIEDQRPPSS